jgi:histidine ammonia-lyase
MSTPPIVSFGAGPLTAEALTSLAEGSAVAEVTAEVERRLERSYRFVEKLAADNTPVYGLTTGCGPLASSSISAQERQIFQRNLIRSHAVTLGDPHPTLLVRAAMGARAHVLAKGHSGVDPDVVRLFAGMLNGRIHPIVREVGSVGASGDLVELAQIALAMIGEGEVELGERRRPAGDALREGGLRPLQLHYREGLALINGTSFHSGAAAILLVRAQRIVSAAQVAATLILEALRGNGEAFAAELQAVRPHAGQARVAERVRQLVRDSSLVRPEGAAASRQDAYSLRCIPQIIGAVVDLLASARTVVEIELDSITDNPLFLADEGRVLHGGNFHGQPVAMAIDQIKLATVQVGVQSERRIARVLDATLNAGLPPFLVRDRPGLNSGFMGLQYCASSMAADNAVLAAPASVRSVPTNANNQDIVSMGMVAARQASRVLDNVERMVAIELLCGAQALELRGATHAGRGTQNAYHLIRENAATLDEDRPLGGDVEAMCRLVGRDGFAEVGG